MIKSCLTSDGAFTASSTILSIYIQQFWDIVRYEKTAGCYKCQLDEQWFDLTKDTLRDAIQITPVNNNKAFSSPPSSDALINFVNELGYPKLIRNLSNVILWGVVNRAHLDYAERIWEEFTQSIHTFIEDKNNLAQHTHRKKKATLIVIPSISAKGTKREVFGMPIPGNFITADIQGEPYYQEYLEKVAKHQRYLAGEQGSDPDSPAPKPTKATKKSKPSAPKADLRPPVTKLASSQEPEPKPALAKPGLVTKRRKPTSSLRSIGESVAEGIHEKEPRVDDEEADVQMALEESLKSIYDAARGPLPPVVIREPESGKYQLLPEVQGKGKEKFIFQRRTSTPTRSSGHDESSSLYAELGLTDNKVESDEDVPRMDAGVSKVVDEIVIDAVDWAIQAPLRSRFRDFPEADMKEILHQRMWETNSYKTHEDHMMLYEALEKSMNRDHTEELLKDLAEARKKKKKSRDSSNMPHGSPPHQPPPHPPPVGLSGTSGYPRASGSSQVPPPPSPPRSTNQEDRPATPEPAWSIPSSDLPVPKNNWTSALTSTYSPLPEDSLLAQTELEYLRYGSKGSRHALSISKIKAAYYPDVGLEQMVPNQMWIEEECKYDIATMSPEPSTTQRQEDSHYCHQLMDQTLGYQTTRRRLPAWD
nr:hypothetical protein [Tanacetum cinerariifolium]